MASQFLPRYGIGTPEHLAFGSREVPALLVCPDVPGRYPGVIIQHGYAAAKEDIIPLALYLATYGLVSLLPDAWEHGERLPEQGRSWKTEDSADYFLDVARETAADLHDALTLMAEREDVLPDKLLVGGFSMGAMTALLAGTEDPRVAGVVSIAGASLCDLLGSTRFGAGEPDEAHKAWARKHDAAAHIANLAPKPLLLSHGRIDDMVPVAAAQRLYDAACPLYAAHPEQLALMLYDQTHTVSEPQLRDAVNWIAPFFLPEDAAVNVADDIEGELPTGTEGR